MIWDNEKKVNWLICQICPKERQHYAQVRHPTGQVSPQPQITWPSHGESRQIDDLLEGLRSAGSICTEGPDLRSGRDLWPPAAIRPAQMRRIRKVERRRQLCRGTDPVYSLKGTKDGSVRQRKYPELTCGDRSGILRKTILTQEGGKQGLFSDIAPSQQNKNFVDLSGGSSPNFRKISPFCHGLPL